MALNEQLSHDLKLPENLIAPPPSDEAYGVCTNVPKYDYHHPPPRPQIAGRDVSLGDTENSPHMVAVVLESRGEIRNADSLTVGFGY